MQFIIAVLTLLAYYEEANAVENCDGIIVHNIKHEERVLKTDILRPTELVIDYNTNTLFFSYTSEDVFTGTESAYINLTTNEFNIIKGIKGGFASAVDRLNNIVYLGGRDGIYQFDYETKLATHLDGTHHEIMQMFFKKGLYYTNYPDDHVYLYKNHQPVRVPELIDTKGILISIDNYDNFYFSNSTGLYVYKKDKDYIAAVGDYIVKGFTSDINGHLFFSAPEGLYFINDGTKTAEKIASFKYLFGAAIDADGSIIYASHNYVSRLKPTKTYCFNNGMKNV